jgi:hypothetical protein
MVEKYGFREVLRCNKSERCESDAHMVMLVWHENQTLPAEQYRKAHWPDEVVDIVVCEDPNVQKAQLGDRGLIYHFA